MAVGRAQAVASGSARTRNEIASLYARHRQRVYAHCARRLRSAADADDATQQTFVYALRSLDRGVVPEHEAAWLTAIADNVCRATLRRAWRRREFGDELEGVAAPEPAHDRIEDARGLTHALAELPSSQRQALLLREWHGLSYREIAGHMDLSEAAVETLLFRARRKLVSMVDEGRAAARRALDLVSLFGFVRALAGSAGKRGALAAAGGVVAVATTVAIAPHHRAPHPLPLRAKPPAAKSIRAEAAPIPPTRVGLQTHLPRGRRYLGTSHETATSLHQVSKILAAPVLDAAAAAAGGAPTQPPTPGAQSTPAPVRPAAKAAAASPAPPAPVAAVESTVADATPVSDAEEAVGSAITTAGTPAQSVATTTGNVSDVAATPSPPTPQPLLPSLP